MSTHSIDTLKLRRYIYENSVLPGSCPWTGALALALWESLDRHFCLEGKALEVPDCCPGESGEMQFTWCNSQDYLEADILRDGTIEFFGRDLLTQELWGLDIDPSAPFPPFPSELLSKLSRFT